MGRRRRKGGYIFAPQRRSGGGRKFLAAVGVLLVLAVATLLTVNFVTNHQVTFEQVSVTVQNLPSDLENWTILHISDLHGQEIGDDQSAIRKAISLKNYSSIVFTGDMIGPSGDVEPFLQLVSLLPQDKPKFLIVGDSDPPMLDLTAHGSLSVYSEWAERVQAAGVILLDEPYKITRGKSTIWFVPEYLYSLDLDSMEAAYQKQLDSLSGEGVILTPDQAAQRRVAEYHVARVGRIRTAMAEMTEKDIQIVLTHTPLTSEYVNTMVQWKDEDEVFSLRNAALVLAGHYTAGQWRWPWGGAIWVPELGWAPEDHLLMGLNYLSGVPQYISPGLGASDYTFLPGRLFNHPTVTMIALTARLK